MIPSSLSPLMNKFKFGRVSPVFIAVLAFLIFSIVIFQYNKFINNQQENDLKKKLEEVLVSKKSQLEKSLYSRIYYT